MKKFAVTVLSLALATVGLTACNKKEANKPASASTTASTTVTSSSTTVASTTTTTTTTASSPTATVASSAPVVGSTTTTTQTTQAATGNHTPLQADLITLLAAGQNLQKEAMAKQTEMEQQLQAKAATVKTPQEKDALQKEMLNDIISFKKSQLDQFNNVQLTEPRVKAVRDKMVASLQNDINATKIALDNPAADAKSKKAFDAENKKMVENGKQASEQLHSLMKEAGMATEAPAAKAKK